MDYNPLPAWPLSVEHRLTEVKTEADGHAKMLAEHAERLKLHERAILGLCGILYIVFQDKFQLVAQIIKGLRQ